MSGCPLPGVGAELVLAGCHLGSTASSEPGFEPETHPAPDADDEASGIAWVLAIARALAPFRGALTHTVRFCFFNAEEEGRIGSKTYAEEMKATGAPIRAVACLDMIGFNSDPHRPFEIHAGYTEPAVCDASLLIAERVAARAADLGALAAQIYRGLAQGASEENGRDRFDGAINRSDHSSFQRYGYPAVVVTEDFFCQSAIRTEPRPESQLPPTHRHGHRRGLRRGHYLRRGAGDP